MTLCFELSMPGVGSWNGRWSGEEYFYAKIKKLGTSKKAKIKAQEMVGKSFRYDFGDGWAARITVREVSGREITDIQKQSRGFCGYDWMVDSIISDLKIVPPSEKNP